VYQISGYLNGSGGFETVTLYKNGSIVKTIGRNQYSGQGFGIISSAIKLVAGDYIEFRDIASKTWNYANVPQANRIQISGPY
jgi:hypothetical protein